MTSVPSRSGRPQVEDHAVRRLVRDFLQAERAGLGFAHPVAA